MTRHRRMMKTAIPRVDNSCILITSRWKVGTFKDSAGIVTNRQRIGNS